MWRDSPCLIFKWRKTFQSFTIKNNISHRFSISIFIKFMKFPYISSILRVFIMYECWILSNTFSVYFEMIAGFFFFFKFVNMVRFINWFLSVKLLSSNWDKLNWSWRIKKIRFVYIVRFKFWFSYQSNTSHLEWVGKHSLLSNFPEDFV